MSQGTRSVKHRGASAPRGLAASAIVLLLASGCAVHGALFQDGDGVVEAMTTIRFHHRPVPLHLARRPGNRGAPLVLYVTGDGGWRGADPLVFRTLVQWGYPAAGMEARDYLDHLGDLERRATPRRLAADYAHLMRDARRELGLGADTGTILVGFSRGAGLAVLAAGQAALRPRLLGVVAMALTDEEDELGLDTAADADPGRSRPIALNPYRLLPALESLPVAVIQSTRDRYVTAAVARPLFGPDTESRRLVVVDSDGHTFGGARDRLLDSLRSSLQWIAGPPS
jgi:pimeloyl-ACP methyl ester carboxylesterase